MTRTCARERRNNSILISSGFIIQRIFSDALFINCDTCCQFHRRSSAAHIFLSLIYTHIRSSVVSPLSKTYTISNAIIININLPPFDANRRSTVVCRSIDLSPREIKRDTLVDTINPYTLAHVTEPDRPWARYSNSSSVKSPRSF